MDFLQKERLDIQDIVTLYQYSDKYVSDIMAKTVTHGRMTFQELSSTLQKVWVICKDKKDFELVCEYFEKITLEGVRMLVAGNWWLRNMRPNRQPNVRNGCNAIKRIVTELKIKKK